MAEQRQRKRLKKQPRRRRLQTAVAMPRLRVPKTARRRRRRNQRQWLQRPKLALKSVILSARWISLALLAISVYALYLTAMDESFYLTLIPVEGSDTIPPAEIVAASGLGGAHVFSVDPTIAAERINSVPGVTSASVSIQWPNVVAIQVTEDSPIAIWRDKGTDYWVNRNGTLMPARSGGQTLLKIESEIPAVASVPTVEETTAAEEAAEEEVVEVV
ncbi:MAG: FtsQ-type POTRA domain-containing protein, partial [Chloroflexota bacterium]